jgi:hypothetical protein
MDALSTAHRNAMEARQQMLDARPKDTIPPLPDSVVPKESNCSTYFQTAADLYMLAARAYANGDVISGHTYELWAYQHLVLGQVCEARTDGLDDRGSA